MGAAWRITNNRQLRELASRGVGFVIDPFNRRWHGAGCRRVGSMTVGEPKWFAPDRAALNEYLEARLAGYPTAKTIDPCPVCAPGAARVGQAVETIGPPAETRIAPSVEATATRHSLVYTAASRVTFGPKLGTAHHAVRADLRRRLKHVLLRDGEKLHAVFAGSIPANSDVENYLLYNIFDSATNRLLLRGVRFDLDPASRVAGAEYRYASAPATAAFAHWDEGVVAAEWEAETIVAGTADRLLSRVWWTLRGASVPTLRSLPSNAKFCATVRVMLPAGEVIRIARPESIKRLIDGLVSAFQHHEAPREARARIAAALGVAETVIVAELLDRGRAVLGPAERPIGVTKAGVQWNPDDTRLVAADVSFEERNDLASWLVAGRFAAARQKS